jgi:hypothetical protein
MLIWKNAPESEGYSGPGSRDASGRTQKFQEHPSNLFLRYVTTVPQSLLLIIDPLATIDLNIDDHRRLHEAGS